VDARHKAGHDERENEASVERCRSTDSVMAGLVPAIYVFGETMPLHEPGEGVAKSGTQA
jgi:hypothetical protein